MWNGDALPLIRVAMSRDRLKMMLRFDNENTRGKRVQTDKAAPIRNVDYVEKKFGKSLQAV